MKLPSGVAGKLAELRRKHHRTPPAGANVKHSTGWNLGAEHLFQAKRLRAKLDIVIVPPSTSTTLILNWKRVLSKLDQVGDADQSQSLTAEPHATNQPAGSAQLGHRRVGMHIAMRRGSFKRVPVLDPDLLRAVKSTTPLAE
ncbi:MAG TPA: hypothetical protein VHY91_12995 [Pirellulales bacterium]|jgi:hypothetical protein|nr:hypothetical protein [Pirellulales bacterium]